MKRNTFSNLMKLVFIIGLVLVAIVAPVTNITASHNLETCGTELLDEAWELHGFSDAAQDYQSIQEDVVIDAEADTARVRINLNGFTFGDGWNDASLIFLQYHDDLRKVEWYAMNLLPELENGLDGWQYATVMLSDFTSPDGEFKETLTLSEPLHETEGLTVRFWAGRMNGRLLKTGFTVDISSVIVYNSDECTPTKPKEKLSNGIKKLFRRNN